MFTARRTALGLSAILVIYLVLVGYRGVLLIAHGGAVPVLLGIGVLLLPLLGLVIVIGELRFGRAAEQLGRELAEPAGTAPASVPRRPSGRIDPAAADALFAGRQAEVEAAPQDWQAWYRLAAAYGDARDAARGRRAMRHAIALYRAGR